MITRGNYVEKVQEFGVDNLDDILKSTHKWYMENQEFYEEDKEVKETIDLYFRKLERFIHQNPSVKPPPVKQQEKPEKPKAEKRTKAAKAKQERKAKAGKKEKPDPSLVESIKEEVKIIKRYVGLHNKKKDAATILNLIKTLQKALVEKRITSKSRYADEIRLIQKNLLKVYNGMDKEILITINDKDLSAMTAIAGGEKVYASIGYIKRFIGMQGKAIDKDRTKSFIDLIEKAISKGRLGKNDPYLPKVKLIVRTLKNYMEGKDSYVSISQAELNGLEGILKSCGCGEVRNSKRKILPRYKISQSKVNIHPKGNGLSGVMSASEVANQQFVLLPFSGKWAELIGKPEKNFTMMIHGEPGAGKSTLLMKFAKYLSGLGKLLYMTSEEFGSSTLTSKVNEYLNPLPPNIDFAPNMASLSQGGKEISDYDFVIFDSITDLGINLEDFKKLKKENPQTAFILVLQNTKDGHFKGGKEWEHEVQVAGEVRDGVISIYKNRFGQKGEMNFFEY